MLSGGNFPNGSTSITRKQFPDLHGRIDKGTVTMGATKRCLCLSIIFAFTIFSCDGAIENRIQKGLNRQNLEILNDEKLHVYLVGSGGPMNNSKRLPTCTAVIAGGQFLLVDAGPGTWRNADLLNLPIGNLTAILLTHFHSDHIGDLGEVNFGSWFAGRKERLEIFGPEGVDRVVKGFSEAYALDTSYRVAHHGADVMNPEVAIPISRTIKLKDADSSTPVLDRNGLKVYAFSVDHAPVNPAFGYRF
jgi:ribonuclease Z